MDPQTIKGLTSQEVFDRVKAGKVNDAHEQTSRALKDILRANIITRFNALLLALVVVILAVGSPKDALFGLVIIINSAIGIFQEVRAKRVLDRLAILNAPVTLVLRDGAPQTIPIKEVVLDDVVMLRIGDQVPADGLVLASEGLEIDESLLTGEADPMVKQSNDSVLSGSIVVAGQGYMRTVAVGADAYAHKITGQVKRFKVTQSELVYGTNKLLGYISLVILVVAPLLIWGQIGRSGNGWQEAMVRSIAAIVGMVPEGLVLLTSLAFMLATLALARRKVLVQQLPAVEGLARVDVLCLDKTGTLTEGKITFDQLVMIDAKLQERAEQILGAFAVEPISPTLQALHEAFATKSKINAHYAVPFSSARKWSALTVNENEHWIMGAPEMVWRSGDNEMETRAGDFVHRGKRVLVLVRSTTAPSAENLPDDMQLVALIVLAEKIRADAKETLGYFARQGVVLRVISGDNPRTVGAIAEAVGLDVGEPVDARSLPQDNDELAEILEKHSTFGRVNPDQKRAFVKALQSRGHVVAMTGDGVNDALALKDADIGIAMGGGAQATKAIAELVLLDNKFSEMPHALAEGRRVIANIERVANLFVIKNVYSLFLALAVTVAALPYPFLPRHLSVLSALTIGIPAFFLSLAPNNRRYVPGFLRRVLGFALPTGIVIAVLIFASYFTVTLFGSSPQLASTVASSVVMAIGVWVLFCLARPMNYWKTILIVSLGAGFVGLLAIPWTREFLNLAIEMRAMLLVFAFGPLGIICVEVFWRRDQKIHAVDPRLVVGDQP
jgi:cation-transporting ATPase E